MKISELPFVYFCTGARNQTLLPLFNSDRLNFEIDERAASFKALGFAKSLQQPVAICTTSGTAVSECLSAMVEAFYSDVPILLITGDRPLRMQKTGAPQTINHEIITREYRKTYLEMSLSELQSFDLSTIHYPAHINVVIENESEKDSFLVRKYENSWEGFELFLRQNPRPLILISHETTSMRPFITSLLETGLPFYAESLSQGHDLSPIKFEIELVNALKNKCFTSVIRIGHTPLSKAWRMLESYHLPTFCFDSRGLTGLSYGSVLKYSSAELMEIELWWLRITNLSPFLLPLKPTHFLKQLLTEFPESELACLSKMQEFIPEGSYLFLGNSLSIRFFEIIQTKNYKIYGNRGANGIDGQLATAIGLAQSTKENVYCILGDLTTRYDLSSLANLPKNLKLVIMNNYGGRIFEVMGMRTEMVMNQDFNFEKIIQAFGLNYARNNLEYFNSVQVFEFNPSNNDTMSLLDKWES
jgi:2-succinyl-5-enolpyruvyl-6-hydroxy-3-cyclohexene-1-carboxylate synthase